MRRFIASVVALLSGTGAIAGTVEDFPTKQISYRGGLVVFSMPKSWIEEYESEGGGTFYERRANAGTLRLNVISARAPRAVTAAQALTNTGSSSVEALGDGNALAKGVSRTTEQGQPITLFWWHVANVLETDHLRIASFTYTVLGSAELSVKTASDLSMLEKSVREVRFGPVDSN